MRGTGKKAILVGGGPVHTGLLRTALMAGYDLLLAVDGGGKLLVDLGYQPQLLLGDFDSLPRSYEKDLRAKGVQVLGYQVEKDWTDLELAFGQLIAQDYREALVFGALGGRLDHTLANIALLYRMKQAGMDLVLIGDEQAVTLLTGQEKLRIIPFPHGHFSLLPYPMTARGVSISGAKYTLDKATLELGTTRGIHNEFLRKPVAIGLDSGSLLIIVEGLRHCPEGTALFQRLPRGEKQETAVSPRNSN
ncbi:MAG: thiamine diphosphokinase [Firmicutes bacterium]|nr:thiamine diphosphokinase [Bacillota bacterium]